MSVVQSLARELDEAAAAFAKKELGAKRARAVRETDAGFDRALFERMAQLGWTSIVVPEAHGGLGLGVTELAAVAKQLARHILPEPLTASAAVAALAIASGDNEALKSELLRGICDATLVPVVAWQERGGDLDGLDPQASAAERNGAWELSGTKLHVPCAATADGFVVSARAAGRASLFWIPASASGVRIEQSRLADGTSSGTVRFEGSIAQCLLSTGELGGLTLALDAGRVVASAELLGVAEACRDITLQYLRTRSQFGKLIGSFQALQHRAVDLFMRTELARSALDRAASTFDREMPAAKRSAAASHVKARCSETALEVARESIQMHGAIGWTDECDVGLYVKRALVLSASWGHAAAHRRRYASLSPFAGTH